MRFSWTHGIGLPQFQHLKSISRHLEGRINITASRGKNWKVSYQLHEPARQLAFERSPDKSRSIKWITDREFEIITTEHGEIARRRDGGTFTEVSFTVTPAYATLPKDYAPFSPFGDGSTLFHTGRFFACTDVCPDDPKWSMRVTIADRRHILLNGERQARQAAWVDSGSGRNIYIGETQPVETQDVITVLDRSLPSSIHKQLVDQLPRFMRYFSAHLGELPLKPMLFASYDASHRDGWGRQGGTLPGQVFTHFYGKNWPEQMAKPDFANDLARHFAHEAAHLYQRQIFSDDSRDAWIHEGAAEAFAALAMRASGSAAGAFVESRIETAEKNCVKHLGSRTIQEAINASDFDAAYSCGLILNLSIDAVVRRASPRSDGLFAVWRDYIGRTAGKDDVSEKDFLASLTTIGGRGLAESVRRAVRVQNPDLHELAAIARSGAAKTSGISLEQTGLQETVFFSTSGFISGPLINIA